MKVQANQLTKDADSFIKEEDVNIEPSHKPLFQFPASIVKSGEEQVNKFAYQRNHQFTKSY